MRSLPAIRLKTKTFRPCSLCILILLPLLAEWNWLPREAAAQSVYSQAFTFTTLAGANSGSSQDGVGGNARFESPHGIGIDGSGNLYVGDTGNHTIRKVTSAGVVSTIAGTTRMPGNTDGSGAAALFGDPVGVAVDGQGNVYVADGSSNTIRELTPAGTGWFVSTIAGQSGVAGTNDGTGTNALLNNPTGIAADLAGNLYVADSVNNTIRMISPQGSNWVVSTIAGQPGSSGSAGGLGPNAQFNYPAGVAVDGSGNLFVADLYNNLIREIQPDGTNWMVSTIAGAGPSSPFIYPNSVGVDSNDNVFVGQFLGVIAEIVPVGGGWSVSDIAGAAAFGFANGTGTNAQFNFTWGAAVNAVGNLFVVDTFNNCIRSVTSGGVVSTLAGLPPVSAGADGTGAAAQFNLPGGLAVDSVGNIYVADSQNYDVREVTSAGVVTTIAGRAGDYGGANGIGSYAQFHRIEGVAVDPEENVYVTDFADYYISPDNAVRKITPGGVVSTIATGFYEPYGIAADRSGHLFMSDKSAGIIYELTENGTNWDLSEIAQIYQPTGIAVDPFGNVYVSESANVAIAEISPVGLNWEVSVIAGGSVGSADGVGTNAQFSSPQGLAVDSGGNILVADAGNELIRKITPLGTNWVVSTIGGLAGNSGSTDGTGLAARFGDPVGVAVTPSGIVYVADAGNNSIRQGVFSQYTSAHLTPFTQPPATNQLVVTLLPPQANGQWRFPWELAWRDSGTAATNLVAGEYAVEFRDIPGYFAIPLPGPVAVNGGSVQLTNLYYSTLTTTDTNIAGSLTVNIGPSPPEGAGWRFLGDTTPYYPPGYSTNLLGGTYLIQFAPVAGFATPASLAVQVAPGFPTVQVATYLLATSPPNGVALPAPVLPGNINDLTDYPFGFNGQLQTDVGYGSGVAAETNVVLTAAHLIFNDQTVAYVSTAYWFNQEEAGVFTPDPLVARGWCVLSGYASRRTNDVLGGLGPDQSSPQSRNLDVAALYFQSPVANGGFGGWLPSDAYPNFWLSSPAEKMLVGYPVDGSQFGFTHIVNGQMYETGPQPFAFSAATDPVADQQVYTTPDFLSYPGNSGGPLYVQLNGYYYPAGVYLGELFSGIVPYASAVRAIDSNVVNLITLAANFGVSGSNFMGGGVITIIPSLATTLNNPGYLVLQLGPPAAVQAGAAWKLANQPSTDYSSANPSLQEITSSNSLVVQYKPIQGWNLPTNQSVIVTPGLILTNTAYYSVASPSLTLDLARGLGISGTTNTSYQIQIRSSLAAGYWQPLTTAIIINTGFNSVTNPPPPGFFRALWLTNN